MALSLNDKDCHTDTLDNETPENDTPVIALVGMPNSGKTTLFNTLTGSNFKTSNYPGATVEYSVGSLIPAFGFKARVMDSPGIISLNPSSPDEDVTIDGLFNNPKLGMPDVVIVSCDATQLSRQLFLVNQVIATGFKTVVALAMNDLLDKKDLQVSEEKLSGIIGAPVIKINSKKKEGIDKLAAKAKELLDSIDKVKYKSLIHKPGLPTIDDVARMYDLTEETERKVLEHKKKRIRY